MKRDEAKYQSAQAELQALYGRIFDGPTQGAPNSGGGTVRINLSLSPFSAFPEDDRLEYELIATIRKHEQAQGKVNAESRAAELLARAAQALSASHQSGVQASGYSTYGTKNLSYPRNLPL